MAPLSSYAILGGKNVEYKDYKKSPLVGVLHSEDRVNGFSSSYSQPLLCSATLLNARTVLTAAHCVPDGEYIYVSRSLTPKSHNNTVEIRKSQIFIHKEFDKKNHINDIAIIKLNEDLEDTSEVGYPSLSETSEYENYNFYGYGKDKRGNDGQLRLVTRTKADLKAKANMDTLPENFLEFDQTNGMGICSGDSGGPILTESEGKSFIVAIHTIVLVPKRAKLCHYSGVSTKVSTVLDWIKSYLK
ncbi:MAG: S1 family peptidase [Pseudobdellovibrio sp.]